MLGRGCSTSAHACSSLSAHFTRRYLGCPRRVPRVLVAAGGAPEVPARVALSGNSLQERPSKPLALPCSVLSAHSLGVPSVLLDARRTAARVFVSVSCSTKLPTTRNGVGGPVCSVGRTPSPSHSDRLASTRACSSQPTHCSGLLYATLKSSYSPYENSPSGDGACQCASPRETSR
jgi:hypothetical protein